MKIKFFLLFITLTIVVLNTIQAVGFSPSSLTFELEPNQEECKMVTIDSESKTINVSDSWAENENVEWKVSSFNTDVSNHGITISYDSELSIDEREVEVCLSGTKSGEFHGVLLFQEEQQGSSIIQFGVWLKVVIADEQPTPQVTSSSSSGSGGGGGGGGFIAPKTSTNNSTINSTIIGNNNSELSEENKENGGVEEETEGSYSRGITGRVIEGVGGVRNLAILGLIVIVIAAAAVYNKRKNKQSIEGV